MNENNYAEKAMALFKEGYNWFELNYRKYVGLYTYVIKHSTKLKQKE